MSESNTSEVKLPDLWGQIIEAITSGPKAWMMPDELSSTIGLDEKAIVDELSRMDEAGLIDTWERAEGIAVTLSSLAAERFGYRIVEYGYSLEHRWAREGDPDPPVTRAFHVMRSASTATFDFLIDPTPGPAETVAQSEQAARFQANGRFGKVRRGAGRGEPPRPTLILGTGLVAWPGATSVEGEPDPCPACGSQSLPPHVYCLCCDRWGLESEDEEVARTAGGVRNPGSNGFFDPDRYNELAENDRRRRRERRTARLAMRHERQAQARLKGRGPRVEGRS